MIRSISIVYYDTNLSFLPEAIMTSAASGPKVTGQAWQNWPIYEDEGGGGETSSSSSSSISTPSGMATPTHWSLEDVMKLPKKDMKIFGQCPIQDDFTLVVCDSCGKIVKIEAFEHHYRLRHDSNGVSLSGSSSSVRTKTKRPLRPCTVDLLKEDLLHSSISSSSTASLSSASSSSAAQSAVTTRSSTPAAIVIKEEPPLTEAPTTTSTAHLPPAVASSTPVVVAQHPPPAAATPIVPLASSSSQSILPPPAATGGGAVTTPSAMEIFDESSSSSFIQPTPMDESEEADSTTQSYSNVISIPDTEPLPHGMSNDLMAMVAGEISPSAISVKSEPAAVDSTSSVPGAAAAAASSSSAAAAVAVSAVNPSSIQINSPLINLQLNVPPPPPQQLSQQPPQSVLQSAAAATATGSSGDK